MQIRPGVEDVLREQVMMARLLVETLREELGSQGPLALTLLSRLQMDLEHGAVVGGLLAYPGLWALADRLRDRHQGTRVSGSEDFPRLQLEARHSAERADFSGSEMWRVDLTPPERHLRESLERAFPPSPRGPGLEAAPGEVTLTTWGAAHRQVFSLASQLLAVLWPEMLSELRLVVRQVALMDGGGVDGFTDLSAHGAIFVNTRRLFAVRIPPEIRFAEALIQEGCHTRCNAAAVVRPFLKETGGNASRAMALSRVEPHPLTALVHQLIVRVRCMHFYERVVDRGFGGEATAVRSMKLREQALQALRALQPHLQALTDHGLDVVWEAGLLLAQSVIHEVSVR